MDHLELALGAGGLLLLQAASFGVAGIVRRARRPASGHSLTPARSVSDQPLLQQPVAHTCHFGITRDGFDGVYETYHCLEPSCRQKQLRRPG